MGRAARIARPPHELLARARTHATTHGRVTTWIGRIVFRCHPYGFWLAAPAYCYSGLKDGWRDFRADYRLLKGSAR